MLFRSAAHDGAGAGTAGGAVLVVHDGGQQDLLLTGGADVQDGAVGAVLFLQLVVKLFAQNTQILSCVEDLDLVVDDIQVAPVGGLALDDQRIPAGELQLAPQMPPELAQAIMPVSGDLVTTM